MSDHDALLAAICAEPHEDTPRLALADWLEENGQVERAAFMRAQIELAHSLPWEPFAVRCKWRKPEWVTGKPFRDTLPQVDGNGVEWHAAAFRRGLGWRLNVRSLIAWEQTAARVLAGAPVGEMHLWSAATIDQWRDFAASPVVPRLRKVHFVASPVEPLRVLRETPAALGITDLYFERASSAGISFVIEDLLASPLGQVVRGLHLHMGYESLEDLIDALHLGGNLERLSLHTMGLTVEMVERLLTGSAARNLTELDLRANPLGSEGVQNLAARLPQSIRSLGLASTGIGGSGAGAIGDFPSNLRRLELGGNPVKPRAARVLARSQNLAGLRSLDLHRCGIGDRELRWLTRAKFWPNLVELDLRDNPIPPAGVRHLLDAPVPADLAALVLTKDTLGADSRHELREKYGERVVFGVGEPGT